MRKQSFNTSYYGDKLEMAYSGGNHLWYSYHSDDYMSYTEATFSGVGVYKSIDSGDFSLQRLDLIGGGYRTMNQNGESRAYFPITDAQGNVRMYANHQGVVSAYDYLPYGMTITLKEDSETDRKRWQSKEYDGEHDKYYFGARYFDPLFGQWMSPDPAGQFANPYSYGNDPINYIDPNGEAVHIVAGAIVGAVAGTVSGIMQCSGPGEQSCVKSITYGSVGGAAVGAAAAATGGAVAAGMGGGVSGGIVGGAAGGAAGGAGNYAVNSLATGQDMTLTGTLDATWKGGLGGAVSGGVGSYMGNAGWNLLGKRGAEITAAAIGGGVSSSLNGEAFLDGFAQGAVIGTFSSVVTGMFTPSVEFDGTDLSQAELKKGDIVGFGPDGSPISNIILAITGEDFSHVGVIDADDKGMFVREATSKGKQIPTKLSDYSNRPYKIYGNRQIVQPFVNQDYGYNLVETNCTSQATRWTGMRYTNNPGILYRNMNGIAAPFFVSSTLQGYQLW